MQLIGNSFGMADYSCLPNWEQMVGETRAILVDWKKKKQVGGGESRASRVYF